MWPLAALVLFGTRRRSLWALAHAREALAFGLIATAVFLVVLALPLLLTIVAAPSPGMTIAIYLTGMIADLLVAGAAFAIALGAARRAARGDRVEIVACGWLVRLLERIRT